MVILREKFSYIRRENDELQFWQYIAVHKSWLTYKGKPEGDFIRVDTPKPKLVVDSQYVMENMEHMCTYVYLQTLYIYIYI